MPLWVFDVELVRSPDAICKQKFADTVTDIVLLCLSELHSVGAAFVVRVSKLAPVVFPIADATNVVRTRGFFGYCLVAAPWTCIVHVHHLAFAILQPPSYTLLHTVV